MHSRQKSMGLSHMICVGKIVAPQGLQGAVRILIFTESSESFFSYDRFFEEDGTPIVLIPKEIRNKDLIIAFLKGVKDRTEASSFVGKTLWIKREQLSPTQDNEYYYADLVGLNLIDEEGRSVGLVENVKDFGGGAFLEFTYQGKAATLPFRDDVSVDLSAQTIKVKAEAILC